MPAEPAGIVLGELARLTGAELHGDPTLLIQRVATLENADTGSIGFLSNPRYRRFLESTRASAVILSRDELSHCRCAALVVRNPYLVFAQVAGLLSPRAEAESGVHARASVHPSATLGDGVSVGPGAVVEAGARLGDGVRVAAGAVIGAGAELGEGCRIGANASLYPGVVLGRRVIVHGGAVLGADGFGFANDGGRWVKVPQVGRVRVGDDVEIGANTTIDCGAVEDTVIEEGVKLDNLIQIGHNVRVGAHTAIAACTAVAGSAVIGRHCMIAGAVAIAGHLEIADRVTITGMTTVTRSITEPGSVYSGGTQMAPNAVWRKSAVRFNQLDEMYRRLRQLEAELEALRGKQ